MDSEEMRLTQVGEMPSRGTRGSKFDKILDVFESEDMKVAVVRDISGSVASAKVSLQGRIKNRGLSIETHVRGGELYLLRKAV